jgi:hypothetical protein
VNHGSIEFCGPALALSACLSGQSGTLTLDFDTDEFAFDLAAVAVIGGGSGSLPYWFLAPALQWVINHNLGRKVQIECFSPGGVQLVADSVINVNDNQTVVSWVLPQPGYAVAI